MVIFITNWLTENNIPFYVDSHQNVYATKSESNVSDDFYYPCVISHTDTVHTIDTINIKEEQLPNAQGEIKLSLKAYNDFERPTGIGGDDKAGVFACLTLLKELPYLKAAFFVSEETGCHGSKQANPSFFSNVGYAIQFDAPENWMITETCFGAKLFDRDSEFFRKCDIVLNENMNEMVGNNKGNVFLCRGRFVEISSFASCLFSELTELIFINAKMSVTDISFSLPNKSLNIGSCLWSNLN